MVVIGKLWTGSWVSARDIRYMGQTGWVTEPQGMSERIYVSGRTRASTSTVTALNWSPSVGVHVCAWVVQRRCLPRLRLLWAPDGGSWEGGPSSSSRPAPMTPHPWLCLHPQASSEWNAAPRQSAGRRLNGDVSGAPLAVCPWDASAERTCPP